MVASRNPKPILSVLLTSHNGADKLATTLPALIRALVKIDSYELIIIDNASSDNTAKVASEAADCVNPIVISEPRKGKSYALNRGLEAARGGLIIFVDDDIRPDENWLTAFCEAATKYPKNNLFAGQIRPDWQAPPPAWLQHLTDTGRSFGCTPIEHLEGPCDYTLAKGANLMLRRSPVLENMRFDEGPQNYGTHSNKGAHGGEDTKFAYDILGSDDNELIYIPSAVVFHAINKKEMRLSSVLTRYKKIGKSRAYRLHLIGKSGDISGLGKVLRRSIKALFYALTMNSKKAAQNGVMSARFLGEWLADRQIRKTKRSGELTSPMCLGLQK